MADGVVARLDVAGAESDALVSDRLDACSDNGWGVCDQGAGDSGKDGCVAHN